MDRKLAPKYTPGTAEILNETSGFTLYRINNDLSPVRLMSNIEEELDHNDANLPLDIEIKCVKNHPKKKENSQGISSPVLKDDSPWRSDSDKDETSRADNSWRRKSFDKKQDDDISASSVGDICRICHMGGFPPLIDNQPMWEWRNDGVNRVPSQMSTLSSYAYLGPLISACKCRGTVALVHAECLERWLTESGHTRCELCGHKYVTKRVPRHGIITSLRIWFKTVVATRQMLFDILYLLVTTPLALFSCYICALALRLILESGFYEIPWMIIAMLPTCTLTLIAYWGWLITLGRYTTRLHSRRWRRFWRNNFVVRLLPDNSTGRVDSDEYPPTRSPISIIVSVVEDPLADGLERDNEAEEFLRIM